MSYKSIFALISVLVLVAFLACWTVSSSFINTVSVQHSQSSVSVPLQLREKLEKLKAKLMHRAELAESQIADLSEAERAALEEDVDGFRLISADKLTEARAQKQEQAAAKFMADNASLIANIKALIENLSNLHDPIGLRLKGRQLADSGNFSEGLSLLLQAADQKDPVSMRILSFYYITLGPEVVRDKVEAAKWDILAEYYWMNELGRLDHSDKKYSNQSYLFTEEERQAGIARARAWLREHKETT